MERTEKVELAVLCLIYKNDHFLLQNRVKRDWTGYVFPGGHIEAGESIVDAVIREVKEETGLTIVNPRLCGVKQFPLTGGDYQSGRYLVFLYRADQFTGKVVSSEEGEMHWIRKDALDHVELAEGFFDLLELAMSDDYSELQYVVTDGEWNAVLK